MNFAGAFRHPSSAQSANKATRIVAVWADFKTWLRGVLARLLAEAPCDDPTAHFSILQWADLPTHHPGSPE